MSFVLSPKTKVPAAPVSKEEKVNGLVSSVISEKPQLMTGL